MTLARDKEIDKNSQPQFNYDVRAMLQKIGEIYRSDLETNKKPVLWSKSQAVLSKYTKDIPKLALSGEEPKPK